VLLVLSQVKHLFDISLTIWINEMLSTSNWSTNITTEGAYIFIVNRPARAELVAETISIANHVHTTLVQINIISIEKHVLLIHSDL